MFRILVLLAVVAGLVSSCGTATTALEQIEVNRSVSAVDATNAWNSVCFQYNFIPKPLDWNVTFAQGYIGQNFNSDIVAITAAVNAIMSAETPTTGDDRMSAETPSTGDDRMRIDIENWGD